MPSPNDARSCRSSLEKFPHLLGFNPRICSAPMPNESYRRCGHGHERHAARRRSAGDAGVARGARLGARARRARSAPTSCSRSWSRRRAAPAPTFRTTPTPRTSTRSRSAQEERSPGDAELEHSIRSLVRWNAMAMVVRANKESSELGGHIASFASAATLYDVGFNHFCRAANDSFGGDLVYFQGHSAPGIYARAFLEGRISEEQMDNFRQEVGGKGLSSYPHPWLMPDFWQFPTVSMGLGPIMAIYQARFMSYLQGPRHPRHRGPQGLGVHGRRRDGRAGIAGRDLARRRARSSTISSSSSTATCSGSTGRCAATARSSRSWKRISAAPAGT